MTAVTDRRLGARARRYDHGVITDDAPAPAHSKAARRRAWLHAVTWAAVYAPLFAVAQLLLLAATCVARHDSWPVPHRPDPKDIAFPLQMESCWLGLILGMLAPVAVASLLALPVYAEIRRTRGPTWIPAAAHLICYAAFWAFIGTDEHHQLITWLMD